MDIVYICIIYGSVFCGVFWALVNICQILSIKVKAKETASRRSFKQNGSDEEDTFVDLNKMAVVESIGVKIEDGASAFLIQEYIIMTVFVIIFGVIVLVAVDFYGDGTGFKPRFYTFIAFLIGSIVSMICGWIGMKIAVKVNYRTTYMAT